MSAANQHGLDAEIAARDVASVLGLPDFVFTAHVVKGRATREIGDALLVANGLGAVVQVKSRSPGSRDDGSAWLQKHGSKAVRQAEGTRRSIRLAQEQGQPIVAHPVRTAGLAEELRAKCGLALEMNVSAWPSLMIIDHPGATGILPNHADCFWITLADWHELWLAIRSVTGVLRYVRRSLEADLRVPLGEERQRFDAISGADVRDHGANAWLTTDAYEDPQAAQLYRELVERVWPSDQPLPSVPMADYRLVVDFLDRTPPSVQPVIGRWILGKRAEQAERGKAGGLMMLDEERLLIYKTDEWAGPASERGFDGELITYAIVRSAEASAQLRHFVPALAIGHLVAREHVDYRYAYTREPDEPTTRERALVWHEGGKFDAVARTVSPLPDVDRTEPCACGSGLNARECPQGLFS